MTDQHIASPTGKTQESSRQSPCHYSTTPLQFHQADIGTYVQQHTQENHPNLLEFMQTYHQNPSFFTFILIFDIISHLLSTGSTIALSGH